MQPLAAPRGPPDAGPSSTLEPLFLQRGTAFHRLASRMPAGANRERCGWPGHAQQKGGSQQEPAPPAPSDHATAHTGDSDGSGGSGPSPAPVPASATPSEAAGAATRDDTGAEDEISSDGERRAGILGRSSGSALTKRKTAPMAERLTKQEAAGLPSLAQGVEQLLNMDIQRLKRGREGDGLGDGGHERSGRPSRRGRHDDFNASALIGSIFMRVQGPRAPAPLVYFDEDIHHPQWFKESIDGVQPVMSMEEFDPELVNLESMGKLVEGNVLPATLSEVAAFFAHVLGDPRTNREMSPRVLIAIQCDRAKGWFTYKRDNDNSNFVPVVLCASESGRGLEEVSPAHFEVHRAQCAQKKWRQSFKVLGAQKLHKVTSLAQAALGDVLRHLERILGSPTDRPPIIVRTAIDANGNAVPVQVPVAGSSRLLTSGAQPVYRAQAMMGGGGGVSSDLLGEDGAGGLPGGEPSTAAIGVAGRGPGGSVAGVGGAGGGSSVLGTGRVVDGSDGDAGGVGAGPSVPLGGSRLLDGGAGGGVGRHMMGSGLPHHPTGLGGGGSRLVGGRGGTVLPGGPRAPHLPRYGYGGTKAGGSGLLRRPTQVAHHHAVLHDELAMGAGARHGGLGGGGLDLLATAASNAITSPRAGLGGGGGVQAGLLTAALAGISFNELLQLVVDHNNRRAHHTQQQQLLAQLAALQQQAAAADRLDAAATIASGAAAGGSAAAPAARRPEGAAAVVVPPPALTPYERDAISTIMGIVRGADVTHAVRGILQHVAMQHAGDAPLSAGIAPALAEVLVNAAVEDAQLLNHGAGQGQAPVDGPEDGDLDPLREGGEEQAPQPQRGQAACGSGGKAGLEDVLNASASPSTNTGQPPANHVGTAGYGRSPHPPLPQLQRADGGGAAASAPPPVQRAAAVDDGMDADPAASLVVDPDAEVV